MSAIIIGAGLMGITTAYALSQRGIDVTVLERSSSVGRETSYANGGQLSYSCTDPLANSALLKKIPKVLLGLDSDIDISPSIYSCEFIRWGYQLLKNCNRDSEQSNAEKNLKLALLSRKIYQQLYVQHNLQFNYQQNGKLVLFSDNASFDRAKINAEARAQLGSGQQILSRQHCYKIDSSIKYMNQNIVGGIYSSIDESGDSYAFCRALATHIRQHHNVKFVHDCQVEYFKTQSNRIDSIITNRGVFQADSVVVAMGIDSKQLCQSLGIALPLYPLKGYSITATATENAPKLSITDVKNKLVYCLLGNQLRVAGKAQFRGYDRQVNQRAIKKLVDLAKNTFPKAADYTTATNYWSGLRAITPNSLPILGRAGYSNLYLNVGQGMLGFTLAPGCAEIIANQICNDQSTDSLGKLFQYY